MFENSYSFLLIILAALGSIAGNSLF